MDLIQSDAVVAMTVVPDEPTSNQPALQSSANLLEEHRKWIYNACVDFICYDLRPMHAFSGDGLASLLTNYGKIYSLYSPIEAEAIKDYLPDSKTVMSKVQLAADSIRNELKNIFKEVFGPKGAGGTLSVDMWTDSYRGVSYLGVKAHYITADFKLMSRAIANTGVDANISHTGLNIIDQVNSVLQNYGILENSEKIMFITDRGPNIKAAFTHYGVYDHIFCYLHYICGIIKEGLSKEPYTKLVISECKSVVTFIKHGHKMPLFAPTLKNPAEPRWSGVITMLKSIMLQWDTLQTVLTPIKDGLQKISNVSIEYVKTLIEFLSPFEQATLELQATRTPTLHLVMMWNDILKDHLEPKTTDCENLVKVRALCLSYCERNENDFSSIWTKVGLFLHPMTKGLQSLSLVQKQLVESMVSVNFPSFYHTKTSILFFTAIN